MKKYALLATAFFLALGVLALDQTAPKNPAFEEPGIKLRFFEGIKEGTEETSKVITSSFLHSTITASIQSEEDLAEEQSQIRRTFNLKKVNLITEAVLKWPAKASEKATHLLRLDGRQYLIVITPVEQARQRRFRMEVFEQSDGGKRNLLDTEVILPEKNIAVFGFEDIQHKPYFLALRIPLRGIVGGVEGAIIGGVEGGVVGGVTGGVIGGVEGGVMGSVQSEEILKKRQEFEKDAIPCRGEIKPPKLIKKVEPVYPEEARKAGIDGVVILEAKIDESGRVMDALILKSVPGLDQAAIDAVRQWVYEPLIIKGNPMKVLFTVTVAFKLAEKDIEEFAKGAVKVKDEIKPPKLIKKVDPVYPEKARKAAVEGIVILQARTDVQGRVKDVMVLRSIPVLNQAAIDAVRQWVYEPVLIDGTAKEAVFTVTVRFALGKEKKAEEKEGLTTEDETNAVKATDEIKPPKLIKKVEPAYPEEARKAGIQGVVILEAMTNEKGDVVRVKVLRSIPELDQAAMAALRQWKYEPVILDGKPIGIVFTVTVNFRLD